LFPGICFPGFARYANKCLSDQTIPEPFIALLYEKAVYPAFLPKSPPNGGAAAPFPSP